MRVRLEAIVVDDQAKALKFYTEVLGFVVKHDIPAGGARWITVVPPDERDGPELLLEPCGFEFARTYKQTLYEKGIPTPLDHVRRIIVFIVNSLSDPQNDWDLSEQGPGTIELLIKATGVPIDHYSYDGVELLRDTIARWAKLRAIRARVAPEVKRDPVLADLLKVPDVDLYAIDVSFKALQDPAERAYLNDLPTSFVLPPEAVDRLRAAAGQIIRESPDFQRLLRDVGARVQTEAVAH